MSRTKLTGANLSGANLIAAYLSGINLFRANLSGADLAWPFPAYTIRNLEWLDGWRMGVINLGEVSPILVAGFYSCFSD